MRDTCDQCERVTDVYTDEWSLCRWCAPAPDKDVLNAIAALRTAGMFTLGE